MPVIEQDFRKSHVGYDRKSAARRPPSIPALAPRRSSVLTKSQIERRAVAHRTMDENRGSAAMRRVLFFRKEPFRLSGTIQGRRSASFPRRDLRQVSGQT